MYGIFCADLEEYIKKEGKSWVTNNLLYLTDIHDYQKLKKRNKSSWDEISNLVYQLSFRGDTYCKGFREFSSELMEKGYESIHNISFDDGRLEQMLNAIKDILENKYCANIVKAFGLEIKNSRLEDYIYNRKKLENQIATLKNQISLCKKSIDTKNFILCQHIIMLRHEINEEILKLCADYSSSETFYRFSISIYEKDLHRYEIELQKLKKRYPKYDRDYRNREQIKQNHEINKQF